jgi:hypothetical protein
MAVQFPSSIPFTRQLTLSRGIQCVISVNFVWRSNEK